MKEEKDPTVAAILGFLFGGFGLFYLSFKQGVIALVVLISAAACTGGVAAPFIWIGCGVWGYLAAQNHNEEAQLTGMDSVKLEEPNDFQDDAPSSSPHSQQSQTSNSWQPPGRTDGNVDQQDQYCGQCGAELREDVQFCTSCGEEVRR